MVTRYLTWPTHTSIDSTRGVLEYWLKEYEDESIYRWGIELKEEGQLIGMIDVVGYMDGDPVIGYVLGRAYWNRGYMTEAFAAVTGQLFADGARRIVIEAHVDNIGSNAVIRKNGYTFTHQETKPCSRFKPEIITTNMYEKVAPAYKDAYDALLSGIRSRIPCTSLPGAILQHVAGLPFDTDAMGRSSACVCLYADMVLKVQRRSEETDNEAKMLEWLNGRICAPVLIASAVKDDVSFILMSRLRGDMLCCDALLHHEEKLVSLAADALKQMQSVPVTDCPGTVSPLAARLARARRLVEANEADW